MITVVCSNAGSDKLTPGIAEKALNAYFNEEKRCWRDPDYIIRFKAGHSDMIPGNGYREQVEAGLITATPSKDGFAYTVELTEKGKKFYKRGRGFCYGEQVVNEIQLISKPADRFGYTVAEVKYTWYLKMYDEGKWVKKMYDISKGRISVKEEIESIDTPAVGTDTFILTDKGWVHHSAFEK